MLSSLDTSSSNLQFFGRTSTTSFGRMTSSSNSSKQQQQQSSNSSNSSDSSIIFDDYEESPAPTSSKTNPIALTAALNLPYIPEQIFIGGRKSKLAVAQSEIIKSLIKENFPSISCPILALTTLGDQVLNKPLYSFGGKSLWTKELEILLLQDLGDYHQLDLVVHSLKDMPTNLPDEFELGCIVKREDPSDALVMAKDSPYKSLDDLPAGSVVGTSSVRRSAQLKKNYPHLIFESIRGNLHTRLKKLDDETTDFKCIILATAGLARLGLDYRITQRLDCSLMYHAVGQGALGIEIRKGDKIMQSILSTIEDKEATICCYAERALMRTLEGGCSVPIGVYTTYDEETQLLNMKAIVISVDGLKWVENEITAKISDDFKVDSRKAGEELAQIMKDQGAKAILDEINFEKINEKEQ